MNRSDLRAHVINRDGACIAALLDPTHLCEDQWGVGHSPYDLSRLTLEHVREHPGGMRRDEPGWCVALCHRGNIDHILTRRDYRPLVLAYLRGIRKGWEMRP